MYFFRPSFTARDCSKERYESPSPQSFEVTCLFVCAESARPARPDKSAASDVTWKLSFAFVATLVSSVCLFSLVPSAFLGLQFSVQLLLLIS